MTVGKGFHSGKTAWKASWSKWSCSGLVDTSPDSSAAKVRVCLPSMSRLPRSPPGSGKTGRGGRSAGSVAPTRSAGGPCDRLRARPPTGSGHALRQAPGAPLRAPVPAAFGCVSGWEFRATQVKPKGYPSTAALDEQDRLHDLHRFASLIEGGVADANDAAVGMRTRRPHLQHFDFDVKGVPRPDRSRPAQ